MFFAVLNNATNLTIISYFNKKLTYQYIGVNGTDFFRCLLASPV
jgi:hypothetical protein